MALWHSELRISLLARWFSLLLHGVGMAVLLLAPWPDHFTLVKIVLLALATVECAASQRRICRRIGAISLLEARELAWRQKRWQREGRPWMCRQAMLLALRASTGEKERLWLWRDSMTEEAWRLLRQQLLSKS